MIIIKRKEMFKVKASAECVRSDGLWELFFIGFFFTSSFARNFYGARVKALVKVQ